MLNWQIGWRELRWVARFALAAGVAVLLAYVPYRVLDRESAAQLSKMNTEIAKLAERRRDILRENRELRLLNRGLRKDPSVILDLARTELGMAFPNEIVVQINNGK